MRGLKLMAQALAGLLAAAAAGLAVSSLAFPGEPDTLWRSGSFRVSVTGTGAALAVLICLAFADGWAGNRRRRGRSAFPGTLWNALGFGLLPGLAVWKAFEQETAASAGRPLSEGWGGIPWLSEGGCLQPCRVELLLAVLAFGAMMLWLGLRKEEIPENGDLLGIGAMLWSAARLDTEPLRAAEEGLPGGRTPVMILYAGILGLILALWTVRSLKQHQKTGYAAACVPVYLVSVTVVFLLRAGMLTVNPLADEVIRAVCVLLAMKAVICMGRISRGKAEPSAVI